MIEIYLLGQLRVYWGGKEPQLYMRPKTLSLWVYLLLHPQSHSRNSVAYTLWPDEMETRARANLRRHLYNLKKLLPEAPMERPWILSDRQTIQWNPEGAFWLDTAVFTELCQADKSLVEAVDLYGGDLLPDLYEDWLFFERERLRDLYAGALSRLTQLKRESEDYEKAIQYSQQLLQHDPLREDAVRQLMLLHYEAGNRATAFAEYERFVRYLRAELGAEPMAETMSLYKNIAYRQFPSRQKPSPGTAPARPDIDLPFVGREDELAQLHNRWGEVVGGKGQILFLGGEAGIGKTSLTRALATAVAAQDGRVLWGNTSLAEPVPYQALTEALQKVTPLLAALNIAAVWQASLTTILPEMKARLPQPTTASIPDLAEERQQLFEAVYRSLSGLADTRPLLLVLEDLHWASSATVALLAHLSERLSHHPILLLLTYREEEVSRRHPLRRLRRRLQREGRGAHLSLKRLTLQAVKSLLDQLVDAGRMRDGLAYQLYRRSEGNPLFLRELIFAWLETDLGDDAVGREIESIPANIQEIIGSRLQRLSHRAMKLAQITAVIGPAFDVEIAREVCGWDEGEILSALHELQDRHLMREAGRQDRFDYAFTHQLIQGTIYAGISAATRKRRHLRVAQVMTELYSGQTRSLAGTIATHFEEGGLPETAVTYYRQAAAHALALYADDEALTFIQRGLALDPARPHRFDLLALRIDIYERRGERPLQQADLSEIERLARAAQDADLICRALRRQIDYKHALGEREEEKRLVAELKRWAKRAASQKWRAAALGAEANLASALGEYKRARALLESALDAYVVLGDRGGQVACICRLAEIATHQSDFTAALQLVKRSRTLSASVTDQLLLVETMHTAAHAAFVQQAFPTCQELAGEALKLSRQIGYREGEANSHKLMGAVSSRQFAVEKARHHYREAGRLYKTLDKTQGQAAVQMNMGILNMRLGHFREGAQAFQEAETLFAQLEDGRGQTLSAINLSAAAIYQRDYATAKEAARRALALAETMGSVHLQADALGNIGEAARELGQTEEAVAHMEAGVELRRTLSGQQVNLATDLHQLALSYLQQGNIVAARETAVTLMRIFRGNEASMLNPHLLLGTAAKVFCAGGDEAKAERLLEEACQQLQKQTDAIPDDASRRAFLQRPANRELLLACREQSG